MSQANEFEHDHDSNFNKDAIVYAINEPSRFDHNKKRMIKMNLNMAQSFGTLNIIFPGEDRPPCVFDGMEKLKEEMAKFRPCDRLLLVGDMDLVAFAAVLAAQATGGKLTLLKWHSRERRYYEVSAPDGLLN